MQVQMVSGSAGFICDPAPPPAAPPYSHDAKLDRDYARYSGDNALFQLSRLRRSAVRILRPMGEWELVPCSLNAMQCLLVDTA